MEGRKLFYVALCLSALLARVAQAAEEDACLCVERWNKNLVQEINAFRDPPEPKKYEYNGVVVGLMGSSYSPCNCTDVMRMKTNLTVKGADLYALAGESTANASRNATDTLWSMKSKLERLDSKEDQLMAYRFAAISATYKSKTAPDSVAFDLDILLRGDNDTLVSVPGRAIAAATGVTDPAATSFPIDNFGDVTFGAADVKRCSGEPPAYTGSDAISRKWNGLHYPPTVASFECADGKFVLPLGKGSSTCDHETLEWTPLEELSCQDGCGLNPPMPPFFAVRGWNLSSNTYRDIGEQVDYHCIYGYRSGDGENSTSNCTVEEGWTSLPPTFFCTMKPCVDDIPQVPQHGATDFSQHKRAGGSVVTYSCVQGYRGPPGHLTTTITCVLGSWSGLPTNWTCTNVHALRLADTVLGEMDLPESELTPEELQRKKVMLSETNYFWMVTIPSIIALIVAMMVCLCCSRTDSPIFNICGGQNKQDEYGYIDYMKKFGNN